VWRRVLWRVAAVAWLAGVGATWNLVFDARIESGARDYVDRQERFLHGLGPRADMDQVMDAARSEGARAASLWALGVLAPGAAVALGLYLRRQA
jgi:hypothetical protein